MGEPLGEDRLFDLQKQHNDLKEAVRRYERRAYLTPSEQMQVSTLKKQKLAAKDQIAALKREL